MIRLGALLALLGLMRLGRGARVRRRGLLVLAGWALTASGVTASNAVVLISGLGVLMFTLLLPSKPDAAFGGNAGWPRLWAEPCLPFFAPQEGTDRR